MRKVPPVLTNGFPHDPVDTSARANSFPAYSDVVVGSLVVVVDSHKTVSKKIPVITSILQ